MDVDEFLSRSEQAKADVAARQAEQNSLIEARNRQIDLLNAMQAFRGVCFAAWDGATFWTPEAGLRFKEWRIGETMRICADARVTAWKDEIASLESTSAVPERNSAVAILKHAVLGDEATVRRLWGAMLHEEADSDPAAEPAFLPRRVLRWLIDKLPNEIIGEAKEASEQARPLPETKPEPRRIDRNPGNSPRRGRKSKQEANGKYLVIAALQHWHEHEGLSVGKNESATLEQLASARCSKATVSRVLNELFGGYEQYCVCCRNGKLAERLYVASGEAAKQFVGKAKDREINDPEPNLD